MLREIELEAQDVSRAFARAVNTLLRDKLATDVYYPRVDRPDDQITYPYVVQWLIPGTKQLVNLSGSLIAVDLRLQLTGVGRDQDEVLSVLDRAGFALAGRRIHGMPGWKSGLVREMPVYQPVTKNEEVPTPAHTPTFRSWAMFRLSAERAPLPAES